MQRASERALAKGMTLQDAVAAGKGYVTEAIKAADTLTIGRGHGPVHHFYAMPSFAR